MGGLNVEDDPKTALTVVLVVIAGLRLETTLGTMR